MKNDYDVLGTIDYSQSAKFRRGGRNFARDLCKTLRADQRQIGAVMKKIKVIGTMDNSEDHTFELANRVYDTDGLSPSLSTCCGGGHQAKILTKVQPLGNLNGHKLGSGYSNSVYSQNGISPALNTMGGGNREPMIVAMRGRDPENPSDRTAGNPNLEQRLEPNTKGISNTLTTVQKDNLVCNADDYRIRKLTPKECWRLQGFSDENFEKAQAVNSNTQLYKQAGNSITVDVLIHIFGRLLLNPVEPEQVQMDFSDYIDKE